MTANPPLSVMIRRRAHYRVKKWRRSQPAGNRQAEMTRIEMTDRESILVIDDSVDIVRFVQEVALPAERYNVLTAPNGEDGFKLATSQPVDLILLDMSMPRMNGLQVLQALRQADNQVPVIFMTMYGSENLAVEAFRLGVRDYLSKPFTIEEIQATVDRALRETRLLREKAELERNLIAAQTVQETVVTLSHYINNQLMVLESGVTLLEEGLQKQEPQDKNLLKIVARCQSGIQNIEKVMTVLRQVTVVRYRSYAGRTQMIDIEAALKKEMQRPEQASPPPQPAGPARTSNDERTRPVQRVNNLKTRPGQ